MAEMEPIIMVNLGSNINQQFRQRMQLIQPFHDSWTVLSFDERKSILVALIPKVTEVFSLSFDKAVRNNFQIQQ